MKFSPSQEAYYQSKMSRFQETLKKELCKIHHTASNSMSEFESLKEKCLELQDSTEQVYTQTRKPRPDDFQKAQDEFETIKHSIEELRTSIVQHQDRIFRDDDTLNITISDIDNESFNHDIKQQLHFTHVLHSTLKEKKKHAPTHSLP